MEQKVRIGVLGCADIAERMVIPAVLSNVNFDLVFVASRSVAKARQFAEKFSCRYVESYQALMDTDLDAIYIPLPTGLHHEWAIKCLEAGKHILVEKSMAESFDKVEDIVLIARKKGLSAMENFQFLYHSQHEVIKQLVAKDTIGEIRCFRSSFGFPPFPNPKNIRYSQPLGGGALLDAGAYTLKATSFILGKGFRVKAANLHYQDAFEVDIFGNGMLVNDVGTTSQVSFGFDQYYQCNYELWGSKGKLVAHRAFTAGPGIRPAVTLELQNQKKEIVLDQDNHFSNLLDVFHQSIVQGPVETQYQSLLDQAKLIHDFKQQASE